MGFVAITFIVSTFTMPVATAWEILRRAFGRRIGHKA